MIEIIKKVFNILKTHVQIYGDCESGFQEYGFDFMIGKNGNVYLAEVNVEPGILF